jgi:hypothetical protein
LEGILPSEQIIGDGDIGRGVAVIVMGLNCHLV